LVGFPVFFSGRLRGLNFLGKDPCQRVGFPISIGKSGGWWPGGQIFQRKKSLRVVSLAKASLGYGQQKTVESHPAYGGSSDSTI